MSPSVLLVEDDPSIARLLEIYLKSDFDIQQASTVQAAIETITQSPFDIVVLDVTLGNRSGWDVLTFLRKEYPSVQTIVMTGQAGPDIKQKALEMGAQAVLHKPITPAEVKNAIRALQR